MPGPLCPPSRGPRRLRAYLRAERSLSPHTVRAYIGDIRALFEHARRNGVEAPGGLDVAQLRSWLALQHSSGAARTTLARRGAAARTYRPGVPPRLAGRGPGAPARNAEDPPRSPARPA